VNWDGERERAAEARARILLAEVAGVENRALYEELGFLVVERPGGYGYLLYPHRPIVIFDEASGAALGEWCVRFRDDGEVLPAADDVLAKWLGLKGGERDLASRANVDPLGTQVDPQHIRRDLERLRAWRASRARTTMPA
jgi:hypothetical protein